MQSRGKVDALATLQKWENTQLSVPAPFAHLHTIPTATFAKGPFIDIKRLQVTSRTALTLPSRRRPTLMYTAFRTKDQLEEPCAGRVVGWPLLAACVISPQGDHALHRASPSSLDFGLWTCAEQGPAQAWMPNVL